MQECQSSTNNQIWRETKHHLWCDVFTTGGLLGAIPSPSCFMCYITLITPLSQGWREVSGAGVPAWSKLGCSAGRHEAAGAAVITTGHARWEGSLKTKQLCVQGRGHAHTSRMIDFSRQPVATRPWISLSDIGFTFSRVLGWQRVSVASIAAAQHGGLQEHHLGKNLTSTRRSKHSQLRQWRGKHVFFNCV